MMNDPEMSQNTVTNLGVPQPVGCDTAVVGGSGTGGASLIPVGSQDPKTAFTPA